MLSISASNALFRVVPLRMMSLSTEVVKSLNISGLAEDATKVFCCFRANIFYSSPLYTCEKASKFSIWPWFTLRFSVASWKE